MTNKQISELVKALALWKCSWMAVPSLSTGRYIVCLEFLVCSAFAFPVTDTHLTP